ncbi:hypothetical protein CKM354_000504000 [Cercospora kikuchii]|uniref:Uncharacterized protein n=1 Tax=Cercospora kikuchii TaxID=84275 RepID=A0A9P3FGD6_9PEZI|nr:uncharacterized protein CKM354_000504000 [Cercospora kikuchii]GIZ41744.1 hypothetical protein CKM354_000504000 [Cercospora kikuchii]
MPTGDWYIDGQLVPSNWVTRRDPNYVPFQSLWYSDLAYPQGANYPQYGDWSSEDHSMMPMFVPDYPYRTWGFDNGNMYAVENPWFLNHEYEWDQWWPLPEGRR